VRLSRFLLGTATVLTAILLQTTVVSQLPLPGAAPDLVLVLIVAFALVEGPLSGMTTGFVAGVLMDALSDHQLGRLALAYAVVGYLMGLIHDDSERSTVVPFVAVGAGGLVGLLIFTGEGLLLGDPRVGLLVFLRSLVTSVPYDVVLTPFVVPPVAALVRHLDPEPVRR
jgi:rod shape-determining protein MreD